MPGQRNSDPKLIDRERFDALTDADIARQIEADPDLAPELTEDDLRWHRYRAGGPTVSTESVQEKLRALATQTTPKR